MTADTRKGKDMYKTTLKIEGMMCGMCEAHICDTIRKTVPKASKVTASRSKKEASFLSETVIDEEMLKKAVNETGYTCQSVSTETFVKKSFFHLR